MLDSACSVAVISQNYDSQAIRQTLDDEYGKIFPGKTPYSWQKDVTEMLLLSIDSIVIAGTGAGKTTLFFLPLFLKENNKKTVVIISPLNELEMEPVCSSIPMTCYNNVNAILGSEIPGHGPFCHSHEC